MSELPLVKIVANPSAVIKHFEEVIPIDGISVHVTLVTMKRSFLLVINNANSIIRIDGDLSRDDMMRGFMNSNPTLKGLSLAIGEHSTCLIESDNSLASSTLASRLSKKLNLNRPVYVANNLQVPHDMVGPSEFTSKLYFQVFNFVKEKYIVDL